MEGNKMSFDTEELETVLQPSLFAVLSLMPSDDERARRSVNVQRITYRSSNRRTRSLRVRDSLPV